MAVPLTPKAPAEVPEPNQHALMELPELKRLALQGHREAARELVSRYPGCETVTEFLGAALDEAELGRLSGGQFNTLNDRYQEQWRDGQLADTVELPNVSESNLMHGWGGSR